ncbi:hypothetical protein PCANC_08868 [Puccinia coronata f. sp. avenae]|uniref:Uncharacterized protein n=1 Tax=Puccinia coronata f. sp. avenae TaxID=200324 RepID=A0A2N5VS63_9BASI|nr:hypothetical protein PCANC_15771 [Puccinia coronata f. sp. avenae]PLW52831.1 hypothetical protein PCANC_08868 [Puccinia coronata f. sp. avenae]
MSLSLKNLKESILHPFLFVLLLLVSKILLTQHACVKENATITRIQEKRTGWDEGCDQCRRYGPRFPLPEMLTTS